MNFELIAHRGFSAQFPENTLSAFSAAVSAGANAIECDVQLSADRVPVIIHDAELERTTNGIGRLSEQTITVLESLDAGSWFAPSFVGEKIPTLKAALELLQGTNLHLYLEVKQAQLWLDADIEHFIEILMAQGWSQRCTVASFNAPFLQRVRLKSSVQLGFITHELADYSNKRSLAVKDGNAVMFAEYHLLLQNPSLIELTRSEGVDIVVWTLNSTEDLQALLKLGINRIITNEVALIYPLLVQKQGNSPLG